MNPCNVCGQREDRAQGMCTNGRCLVCHLRWCTLPGHLAETPVGKADVVQAGPQNFYVTFNGTRCRPRWQHWWPANQYAVACERGERKPELEGTTMDPQDKVFKERARRIEVWRVKFAGKVCSPHWLQRGPAEAYLQMLQRGDRKPEYPADTAPYWASAEGA